MGVIGLVAYHLCWIAFGWLLRGLWLDRKVPWYVASVDDRKAVGQVVRRWCRWRPWLWHATGYMIDMEFLTPGSPWFRLTGVRRASRKEKPWFTSAPGMPRSPSEQPTVGD